MVKFYKMVLYVIDYNGVYEDGVEDIVTELDNSIDAGITLGRVKTTNIDWDDDHELNDTRATIEDHDRYFDKCK